ncbi:MAG: ABC transporter ATP-binding protein [Erysipelotrichaceae bacterium]|nr:ABC transporter ATP-binding protein [Erysipelotrichaceae bacterium]
MEKILSIEHLRKNYQSKNSETVAIEDFSFDLNSGEFVAIVGPSGCGKTTILSILAGLLNKTDGNIVMQENLKIGYMLQQDALFNWRTILSNCLLGLEINNCLNEKNIENVKNVLNTYGLNDFINSYPNSLSGGMRQRVALIRTLATNPDILLLDEPFSALDYQTRLAVADDVYKIIKSEKKSAIMVTHDLAEAISMADRVIVLTKRPAHIKNIYNIEFEERLSPLEIRKTNKFFEYYDLIWKDIDKNV